MAECPTCSSETREGAAFCSNCGTGLRPAASPGGGAATGVRAAAGAEGVAPPGGAAGNSPARLQLKRAGNVTGEEFALGQRSVLGRFDPETGPVDVDLGQLPEASYVSRLHAEIWRGEDGRWMVKDLGSRNGTFVRSTAESQFRRAGEEAALQDGDEVGFGNARFEFRVAEPAA